MVASQPPTKTMMAQPSIWKACRLPWTLSRSAPSKFSATSAVLTTCRMPTPTPNTPRRICSARKEVMNAGTRPPMRNRVIPIIASSFLLMTCMSLPTISVTGMMIMHGMEMSVCTSVWLSSGKLAPMTLMALAMPTTPIISIDMR